MSFLDDVFGEDFDYMQLAQTALGYDIKRREAEAASKAANQPTVVQQQQSGQVTAGESVFSQYKVPFLIGGGCLAAGLVLYLVLRK